jgi:hypothetical protein
MKIRTRPLSSSFTIHFYCYYSRLHYWTPCKMRCWRHRMAKHKNMRICCALSFTATQKWASFPEAEKCHLKSQKHDTEKSSITLLFSRRPNTEGSKLGFLLNGCKLIFLLYNPFSFKHRGMKLRIICTGASHKTCYILANASVFIYKTYICYEHMSW